MKTNQVLRRAGGKTQLAALFTAGGYPITRQAVQQWGKMPPELWLRRLVEIRPEWFTGAKA